MQQISICSIVWNIRMGFLQVLSHASLRLEDLATHPALGSPRVGQRRATAFVGPAADSDDESVGWGVVRLTEPSGPTLWVTVELEDHHKGVTIIGSARIGFAPKIGERVAVSAPHATLHLFNTETGQRLGAA